VSAGVIGVDSEGAITSSNPPAEALLATGGDDLVGRSLGEACPRFAPLIEEAKQTRQRLLQRQILMTPRGGSAR
jgi:two-component system nitrogen regulation sensor histidine kinase NtrY